MDVRDYYLDCSKEGQEILDFVHFSRTNHTVVRRHQRRSH